MAAPGPVLNGKDDFFPRPGRGEAQTAAGDKGKLPLDENPRRAAANRYGVSRSFARFVNALLQLDIPLFLGRRGAVEFRINAATGRNINVRSR